MKVGKVYYLEEGEFEELVKAVLERVGEGGIDAVVVASRRGRSTLKLAEALKGAAGVVSVTEFTYDDEMKKRMKKLGIAPLERVELPIQDRRGMREGLLLLGEGVKAALEAAVIAAGKGLAQGRVIAIAGGGRGLDTVLVVKPTPPEEMTSPDPEKRMAVLEVLALPLRE